MKGQAIQNHRRRKGKKAKSNINLATHNQTLNQQDNYLTGITTIPINANIEC
jgi:hypothetical protein